MNRKSDKIGADKIANIYFKVRYKLNFPDEFNRYSKNSRGKYNYTSSLDRFKESLRHKIKVLKDRNIFNDIDNEKPTTENHDKKVTIEEFDSKCGYFLLKYFKKHHSDKFKYMTEESVSKFNDDFRSLENIAKINELHSKFDEIISMYNQREPELNEFIGKHLSDFKYNEYIDKMNAFISNLDVLVKEEEKLKRNYNKYISKTNSDT